MINITDIRINLISGDNANNLKAIASITIDQCFVVHGLKITETDGKEFVSMPQIRLKDGSFKDIAHPLNLSTRKYISKQILDTYHYTKTNEEKK